jgi:phosphoribosylformylglycinamidine synthase
MQKRVENVIRSLAEAEDNPIISIHDHGAGGHLNCLSELVETTGGHFDLSKFPIGDETLSSREIIGNESQERMGLLVKEDALERIARIAERERAPMYVVGETTSDMHLTFEEKGGDKPIDLALSDMFGSAPKTYMYDKTVERQYAPLVYEPAKLEEYLDLVLQQEGVGCKDWLTSKVDRSVTGRVARQQCQGMIQLPLSDCGVMAVDFRGQAGIATSIGHAPAVALVDPVAGSQLAIAEALTNIVFAPLTHGLEGISLSANWMWPCRNEGEDARLYDAVEAASALAISLGINIPTGKDSLSMTQKYPDGTKVLSPGTVIISAIGEVSDVKQVLSPVLVPKPEYPLYHIDFSFAPLALGGSAFAQALGKLGDETPYIGEPEYFREAFAAIQELLQRGVLVAGHDISAGGMVTALLEMCFANEEGGLQVDLSAIPEPDLVKLLFAENPGVLVQTSAPELLEEVLTSASIGFARIATPTVSGRTLEIHQGKQVLTLNIDEKRDLWYRPSFLMDQYQSGESLAKERYTNYKKQPLRYVFPEGFTGKFKELQANPNRTTKAPVRAAILRDKGTNGEREMAYALYLAGFDVKDVHLTDLIAGRETLEDVQMIVFCGGFSNSDVLGSAKGWAAGILYNEQAKATIDRFYARPDTLSLGICNGCQLMAELGLLYPEHEQKHRMEHNDSHKFESAFVSLTIPENSSVMLGNLSGTTLGVWVAHGEGKFALPYEQDRYHVIARYAYDAYPANPNGSPSGIAGLCSADGRHLALMPHPERAIFPWQCAYYPDALCSEHEATPWLKAFRNAYDWCTSHKK